MILFAMKWYKNKTNLLEVQLPYDPVFLSVGWSVGWSVIISVFITGSYIFAPMGGLVYNKLYLCKKNITLHMTYMYILDIKDLKILAKQVLRRKLEV